VREVMDFEIWKHRRQEMVRQAEQDSVARALCRSRELRGRETEGSIVRQEDRSSKIPPEAAQEDAYVNAKLIHDSVLRMEGSRMGGGVCRIRIFRSNAPGDAPVVVCSELPDEPGEPAANIRLLAEHIAGQVVRRHFPGGVPNLPRPVIWIEQYLTFEGDPLEFALVDFAFWRPRPAGLGTDGHVALGTARRQPISAEDVRGLVN
jgi:hypothetical protein